MSQLAQIGLGGAATGLVSLYIIVALVIGIGLPVLFLLLWYASDIWQLARDLFTGRDLLAESEIDRQLDGRLFDPASCDHHGD